MKKRKFIRGSRFATQKEATSAEFIKINRLLDELSVQFDLPDHTDFNEFRYPWATSLLSYPQFYAARLWEYPYTLLSADLKPKMKVLDVGCGMNPFTIYLHKVSKCKTYGIDPDFFTKGVKLKCHGVSQEYLNKTGLKIIKADMEKIPFSDNCFDRVFCISVIEHVKKQKALKGLREMTRVLKKGGRLIITVDVNLLSDLNRPLELIWESGLIPMGEINLKWPYQRFGNFCDGLQPADVFGFVLYKDDYKIQKQYCEKKGSMETRAWKRSILKQQVINKSKKPIKKIRIKSRTSNRQKRSIMSLVKNIYQYIMN